MTAKKLGNGDLVVVADGEKALFLVNEGDEKFPNLQVHRHFEQENPATGQQAADRPGRLTDGGSHHRSAVQETDWHRIEKERFANEIADRLYKMAHRGAFRHLVVVAPPAVLGTMRKAFHKEIDQRLIGEIAKTLTNHPLDEIERIVTA